MSYIGRQKFPSVKYRCNEWHKEHSNPGKAKDRDMNDSIEEIYVRTSFPDHNPQMPFATLLGGEVSLQPQSESA